MTGLVEWWQRVWRWTKFNVILLAQNQACSDSKQDSRAETCMCNHAIRRYGNIELCVIGVLLLLDAKGLCSVCDWRCIDEE